MVNDWREEHIDGTRQKIQDKECKPQIEIKNKLSYSDSRQLHCANDIFPESVLGLRL